MGFLDQIMGALGTAGSANGAAASLPQEIVKMLGAAGGTGGMAGMMSAFEQGGMGHIFQSWVANGANLPVSAEQIQQVLGNGQLAQLAQSLGIDPAAAAHSVASALPDIIHHLTPNGTMPSADEAGSMLQSLAKQLMPG